MSRIPLLELSNIMSQATGDVDKERGFRIRICSQEELLLHRIDRGIHPGRSALPVATHCGTQSVSRCIV